MDCQEHSRSDGGIYEPEFVCKNSVLVSYFGDDPGWDRKEIILHTAEGESDHQLTAGYGDRNVEHSRIWAE